MGNNCCTSASPTELGKETSRILSGNIKTVVLIVMENRSFDNMLGFLNRLNLEIDGLKGDEYNLLDPANPNSKKVVISDTAPYITTADPPHGFASIRRQIYGTDSSANAPQMNGFAKEAESEQKGFSTQVMSAFKPEAIPVTTALAQEFAVFDKWYASMPASTQPNRFYVHSATSHGAISNVTLDLLQGFPQKTIFDSIDDAGLSFGIYYQNIPATLFLSRLRQPKYLDKFLDYNLFFKKHAQEGKLPNYTVIEQRYFDLGTLLPANDNHPPHDVLLGEELIKEVYETLRKSPQWNEMLLIITYDEHGGLYDHVPPPSTGVPNPDGIKGPAPDFFNFDRLGVRIPTIMISPWINRGTVVHEAKGPAPTSQFEHSSIAATVKKIFNLPSFLTKRDEWAGTFESVFSSRSQPRTDCPVQLPNLPSKSRSLPPGDSDPGRMHEWQQELVLLAHVLNGEVGDGAPRTIEDVGKCMNQFQANDYIAQAVNAFLKK